MVLLLLLAFACEKIYYYPNKPLINNRPKILGHRGGGITGVYSPFIENTLPAISWGLQNLDGVEVDIQISKNKTIWISHNAELPQCNNLNLKCFPESTDEQIVNLDSCISDSIDFTKLEEIFNIIKNNYPEKYISIDVKAWVPCDANSSGIVGMLNLIGDQLIGLINKYNLQSQVLVESQVISFLSYIKLKDNRVNLYLTSLGDFERTMLVCLENGYHGISFKYKADEIITKDHIALIHKKGLRIQLWTINSEDTFNEAIELNPDFIQTDNIPLGINYINHL